jgi:Na+-driven multidrug efflux pump
MRTPSNALIAVALGQVLIGGAFGLGLFGLPQFGMAGVASGATVATSLGALYLGWHLLSGRSALRVVWSAFSFSRAILGDILRVGAVSSIAAVQSVLTILIFTGLLAKFGTSTLAAYGIGARLDFMLTTIAFSIGIAAAPMIGMAIGANSVARARRVAWTSAALSGLMFATIGLAIAVWPQPWIALFTSDAAITASAANYFAYAGPAYGFFGAGLTLYFAAQGAAQVWGPVLAGTLRLVVVVVGGWWLAFSATTPAAMFMLVAAAMIVYGVAIAVSVKITPWGGNDAGGRN